MANSSASDISLAEELFRLLADGGRIEGEEMQALAVEELEVAAYNGELDKVRALIAAGVKLNAIEDQQPGGTSRWLTALMAAVKSRHTEVVSTLVQAGADVNVIADYQGTALMLAASQEDVILVGMLLEAGAVVNLTVRSTLPAEALSCAAGAGNIRAIRLLLEYGARINPENEEEGTNALFYAAASGQTEAVRVLIEAGSWVNVTDREGFTPLYLASRNIEQGSVEILRLLVEAGADVNKLARGQLPETALAVASISTKNRAEKLKILVAAGARFQPNRADAEMALSHIARKGDVDSLRLLESTEVYLHSEFSSNWGPKALIWASLHGYLDVVQFLVRKGAEINVADIEGLTPVMYAGSHEVLEFLLGAGATISPDEETRATALLAASRNCCVSLVRALLAAGVDINTRDQDDSHTPLMNAAKDWREGVLPILIEAGADLEIRDGEGFTALLGAVERNNTYAACLLVYAGADVGVQTNNSWTPLQYAVQNTNIEMVCLLLSAGAEICTQTQPYVQALNRYFAAVLSILPSDYAWELKKKILDLVLEQHDGRFL